MERLFARILMLSAFVAWGPAFAADMRLPAPASASSQPAPSSSNWTGGQVGGNGGGSIANNSFVEPGAYLCAAASSINVNCYETPFSFSGQPASAVGGGFIGYRVQMGDRVIGVEADALWQRARTSVSQSSVCPPGGGACGPGGANRSDLFYGSLGQGWEATFRARYGVLMTPATLIYGTAGLAIADVSGSLTYFGSQGANTAYASGDWHDTRVGGVVGIGVETELAARFKVRAEYRFSYYGSYSKDMPLTSVCPAVCGTPSSNVRIDVNDIYNHKFLLGLGWDF